MTDAKATGRLPPRADLVIAGGGMVGLSLALLLGRRAPQLRVALVEAAPLAPPAAGGEGEGLSPSFDARSTALSAGSRALYEAMGLWPQLAPRACPIRRIHVSDQGRIGVSRLDAADSGLEAFGHVVENRMLGRALLGAVADCGNVHLCAPARVQGLASATDGMLVETDGGRCHTPLAVVADGADSALLGDLGIHVQRRDYHRTAVIANVALSRPHGGVAYERFAADGPVALLPLPDAEGEHRAALVWTLAPARAEALMVAGEGSFLEALHGDFGYRAGPFRRCGARAAYPLRLQVAEEQVRSHLAVVGNAAHFLHPVAGQGFNLALRDVARLGEVVLEDLVRGVAPGSLVSLEAYRRRQATDQRNTILFSDNLPALFASDNRAGVALRGAGLVALDLVPPAQRQFARFGAGLLAPGVRLYD